MGKNIKTCINCHLNEGGHLSPNCCGYFHIEMTAEKIFDDTFQPIDTNDVMKYKKDIIQAMEEYAFIKNKQLTRKDEKI